MSGPTNPIRPLSNPVNSPQTYTPAGGNYRYNFIPILGITTYTITAVGGGAGVGGTGAIVNAVYNNVDINKNSNLVLTISLGGAGTYKAGGGLTQVFSNDYSSSGNPESTQTVNVIAGGGGGGGVNDTAAGASAGINSSGDGGEGGGGGGGGGGVGKKGGSGGQIGINYPGGKGGDYGGNAGGSASGDSHFGLAGGGGGSARYDGGTGNGGNNSGRNPGGVNGGGNYTTGYISYDGGGGGAGYAGGGGGGYDIAGEYNPAAGGGGAGSSVALQYSKAINSVNIKSGPYSYTYSNGTVASYGGQNQNGFVVITWNPAPIPDNNTFSYILSAYLTNKNTQLIYGIQSLYGTIDQWITTNVSDMSNAFNYTDNPTYTLDLTGIDISNWDTSGVKTMKNMFKGAKNFNSVLYKWKTLLVGDMSGMFLGATSVTSNIFSNQMSIWDTSKVNTMSNMFSGATSFNGDVSSFTTNIVKDMSFMFFNASAFSGSVSKWDTFSVTTMSNMFNGAVLFNSNLSTWDTSNVTDMSFMFNGAIAFNSSIFTWRMSEITTMSSMFNGASIFNQDITDWFPKNNPVTGKPQLTLDNMLNGTTRFNYSLAGWNLGVYNTTILNMFSGCGIPTNISKAIWNTWLLAPNIFTVFILSQSGLINPSSVPPNPDKSIVLAKPLLVSADGITTSTITVTLLDNTSNPVSGRSVTLSSGTSTTSKIVSTTPSNGASGSDGIVTFTVSNKKVEFVTYTANDTSDGVTVTQTATVGFTTGAPSTNASTVSAPPDSVVADGKSTSTVTVTITDANSNPVKGVTVSLAASSATSSVSAANGPTAQDGTCTFTVNDTKAEFVTYTASYKYLLTNYTVTQTAKVLFVAGKTDAGASTVVASTLTVPDDGSTTSTITVTLYDTNFNPVSGETVNLTTTPIDANANKYISNASGPSSPEGIVTFTVRNNVAESVIYTASDTSINLPITQTAQVVYKEGIPSAIKSLVSANPINSVVADGNSNSTVTVTINDSQSNPVKGVNVSLKSNSFTSNISAVSGPTLADGTCTFTVTNIKSESVTYSARDETDGFDVLQTAQVNFIAGIPNAGASKVIATPAIVVADGSTNSTIIVTLNDKNNNPVPNKTVSLNENTIGAKTVFKTTPPDASSSADGVVTFLVKSVDAQTITYNATDTSDNIPITQQTQVAFISGSPTATKSLVSANPINSVVADGNSNSTVTVTINDANSNPVKGVTVSLAASSATSKVSGAGPTSQDGTFTFTVTDTKAETVTYTASSASTGNISQTAQVTFIAGITNAGTSTVVANPIKVPVDGTSTSTITVTLNDVNSNPVSGATVNLLANSNNSKTTLITPSDSVSNSQGIVTFKVIDSNAGDIVTYKANDTTNSVPITQTATVTFFEVDYFEYNFNSNINKFLFSQGLLRQYSPASLTPQTTSLSPSSFSGYTFKLIDPTNLPPLYTDSTLGTKIPAWPSDGILLSTYWYQLQGAGKSTTCNVGLYNNNDLTTLVGPPVSIVFQDFGSPGSLSLSNQLNNISSLPSAINSTVIASPVTVIADGISTSTIKVTLLDFNLKAISGKSINLVSTSKTSRIFTFSGISDLNGLVTFTVDNSVVENVIYTAIDTTDSIVISQTALVTFTAKVTSVPSAINSTVIASPVSVKADGISSSIITVTLLDTNSEPVLGKTLTLLPSSSNSRIMSISPRNGVSDANGVVNFTVINNVAEIVRYNAFDISDSIAITQTALVTFTAKVNPVPSAFVPNKRSVLDNNVINSSVIKKKHIGLMGKVTEENTIVNNPSEVKNTFYNKRFTLFMSNK